MASAAPITAHRWPQVPVRWSSPLAKTVDDGAHPEWPMSPSSFDWQVLIFGGDNPRSGEPQTPMIFQFFGKHNSPRRIRAQARNLCEINHRSSFVIRPPANPAYRFRGRDAASLFYQAQLAIEEADCALELGS